MKMTEFTILEVESRREDNGCGYVPGPIETTMKCFARGDQSQLIRDLKEYRCFVVNVGEKKTLPQLRYYWGVVLEDIADQTGYWPDEIHDFNKKNFGIKSTYFIGEEAAELIKGLSKMGKKRASEFIERVIQHWSEKGISIRPADGLGHEEIITAMLTDGED